MHYGWFFCRRRLCQSAVRNRSSVAGAGNWLGSVVVVFCRVDHGRARHLVYWGATGFCGCLGADRRDRHGGL